jgi:hypothetical protein
MPVGLELTSLRGHKTVAIQFRRCAPPAPDLVAKWQHCQFARHAQEPRRTQLGICLFCSVSCGGRQNWFDNDANKKPALERRRPRLEWNFFAATGGENDLSITSGRSRKQS